MTGPPIRSRRTSTKITRYGLLLALLLGTAGFLAVGWSGLNRTFSSKLELEKGSSTSRTIVRPIPTAAVHQLSCSTIRTFPGTVRANRRVKLAFSVPGLLVELNVQEGRSVAQGEPLARLDHRDYEYALDAAKAKYADARLALERARALRDKKVVSRAEYDKAEAAHDIAKAELQAREKALKDTLLIAPFTGVVAKRYVENHEHVEARQPILSFQDVSLIEVVIQVPERLIAHGGASSLRKIQVLFDENSDRWFDASIREFSVQSDAVTRTYDVVVGLTPPEDLKVLPGMTATVKAETLDSPAPSQKAREAVLVPAQAIWLGSDGKSYAWVIEPAGGTPQKRQVEVGALRAGGVEIFSGLRPGELVAVSGVHLLRQDMQVRPMTEGKEGLDG
jgi:RND family efflux transporter MFP subunit